MLPLAQPPKKEDRSFDDWMYRLWKRISSTAGLAWSLIDKTGSSLADLATRNASDVVVTTRYVGNSTNLDTALLNLDNGIQASADCGWSEFTGAGNYYSIATNQLTLLRGGHGHIAGKQVNFTAPQTAAAFTAHAAHWIYIDVNGAIGITTSRTHVLYFNNIILFEVHYDGTDYEVVWENHSVAMDADIQEYVHETIGTILSPVDGTNVIGADMDRVATGTGGAAGDRQIKIVGTADINDAGIVTNIPDSAGAAISWKFYYIDASGYWIEQSTATQFPMIYNNAGTITALNTSGSTDVGLFTCYAIKGEPNSGLPIYLAVIHSGVFATNAAAASTIADGTNSIATGTLFQALEPAQLGHVIVTNNVSGGYISTVNIAKDTVRSAISGGGASSATGISTNTTNFLGLLSAADSNVQAALETLDKTEKQSANIASATTTDLSTATGGYNHITGSVTITSFGTGTAGHLHHLVFDGAPLITHNATSLILPGGANIQAAAGDVMLLRSEGDGTGTGSIGTRWRCVGFTPAITVSSGNPSNVISTPTTINTDTSYIVASYLKIDSDLTINGNLMVIG